VSGGDVPGTRAPSAPPRGPLAGPASREVLRLAGPGILAGFVQLAYHWINQAWVGGLPDATVAAAALSVAVFMVWAGQSFASLTSVGLSALVGRYSGAGRDDAARYVAVEGLRWAAVLSLVVGGLGVGFAPLVFHETHLSPSAAAQGITYTSILYAGAIGPIAQAACDAVWRGHGTTRVPLLTSALGLALNAALDPLLIFGWGPVPGLGIGGAALATVFSSSVAAVTSLVLLRRQGHLSRRRPSDDVLRLDPTTPLRPGRVPGLDLAIGRRLARIGLPACVNGLFFVAVYLFLSNVVMEAGGDDAQAGLGVGLRGEQLAFVVGAGFQAAASVLVSRCLGAGRPDEAAAQAWRSSWWAAAACLAWGGALFAFGRHLVDLWLPLSHASPAARDYALDYFQTVALCLAPQAFEVVLDGAFGGAGMTIPPMIVTLTLSAGRVPLARWAAFDLGLGVHGIWVVIAATAALRGLVTAIWFARGTWRRRTV